MWWSGLNLKKTDLLVIAVLKRLWLSDPIIHVWNSVCNKRLEHCPNQLWISAITFYSLCNTKFVSDQHVPGLLTKSNLTSFLVRTQLNSPKAICKGATFPSWLMITQEPTWRRGHASTQPGNALLSLIRRYLVSLIATIPTFTTCHTTFVHGDPPLRQFNSH